MRPEQALAEARAGVESQRARGGYRTNFRKIKVNPTNERMTTDQVLEWALIEPDADLVVSTRRFGAPISWIKRMMMWTLRQYHGQLESQTTRFNVHLVARVVELEDRLALVEDWLRLETPAGEQPPMQPRRGEAPDRHYIDLFVAGSARPRHEWLPPIPPEQADWPIATDDGQRSEPSSESAG